MSRSRLSTKVLQPRKVPRGIPRHIPPPRPLPFRRFQAKNVFLVAVQTSFALATGRRRGGGEEDGRALGDRDTNLTGIEMKRTERAMNAGSYDRTSLDRAPMIIVMLMNGK